MGWGRKFWTSKPAETKEEALGGISRAQDNPQRLGLVAKHLGLLWPLSLWLSAHQAEWAQAFLEASQSVSASPAILFGLPCCIFPTTSVCFLARTPLSPFVLGAFSGQPAGVCGWLPTP